MDEARVPPAFFDDALDDRLLADAALTDELDRQAIVPREPFCVLTDLVAQRLREPRVTAESETGTRRTGGTVPLPSLPDKPVSGR
jgi:hypothetical protein